MVKFTSGSCNNIAPAINWNRHAKIVDQKISNNILYIPIADHQVKKIQIKNSQEELVDLCEINNPRIKSMHAIEPSYKNTYNDYAMVRQGLYQKLVIMLTLLPKDIGIAYSEGFRPLLKQKEYFDKKFEEQLLIIKNIELAYQETSKFVSPFIENIPVHCTGAAIDMTLFRLVKGEKRLLNMGQFNVVSKINKQHETFSEDTNDEQRANRLLLLNAAITAGMVNYGYEWWHYSFGDKPWAYVKGEKYAIYGLVECDECILSIDKTAYLKQFSIKDKLI